MIKTNYQSTDRALFVQFQAWKVPHRQILEKAHENQLDTHRHFVGCKAAFNQSNWESHTWKRYSCKIKSGLKEQQ